MALNFGADDKISSYGNYFLVGLSGTSLDDTDKRILSEVKPAGILLYKRNFDHTLEYPAWLSKLKNLLYEAAQYAERIEWIVAVDHEGGKVHRIPPPVTHFPAAIHYRENSEAVGRAQAKELRALGINLSFSPLGDIHSNPANPVINQRAFGTTAADVSRYACEYLHGLQSDGVLGCAKHFPGHGDTAQDSHLELPYLDLTLDQLVQREFVPFKDLITAGASIVMTAHVCFRKIDEGEPATLSHKILTGVLRDELGFDGIIMADDIGMQAVCSRFEQPTTVAKAILAGCDMFIVARYPQTDNLKPIDYVKSLAGAVKERKITEKQLHKSFERVAKLFQKLKPSVCSGLDEKLLKEHAKLKEQIEGSIK
jgi:beta-N-acetylhexosaminidase